MVLTEIKDPREWVNKSSEAVTVLFIKHGDNRMQIFSCPGAFQDWTEVQATLQQEEFAGANVESMISVQPGYAIPPQMHE